MIVDTHTHFYDPARPEGVPWPPAENKLLYRTVLPQHFREVAEPHGVTATVVVEASRRLVDNQWILDLAASDPTIVGFVGGLVPNRPEFAAELDRFAANPLWRGIRCGGVFFEEVEAGSFLDDMEKLAAKDLALDVLIRAQPLDGVLAVARRIPDLRIVIDHVLHVPISGEPLDPVWLERYQRAAEQPNVYMKVSALMEQSTVQPAPTAVDFYRPVVDALWHSFGQERLIYGSNWPVLERAGSYGDALRIVRTLFSEKGEEASADYFWRNAKRIYHWVERSGR